MDTAITEVQVREFILAKARELGECIPGGLSMGIDVIWYRRGEEPRLEIKAWECSPISSFSPQYDTVEKLIRYYRTRLPDPEKLLQEAIKLEIEAANKRNAAAAMRAPLEMVHSSPVP